MTAKIQVRRDTTANWNAGTPPTLDVGEIGLDTDLKQIKIGDNTNNWTALPWLGGTLPYFSSPAGDIDAATNRVAGVYRWAGIASITSGTVPAAPIDIKTADGGINMLVLKFGTTVMQHLWTDGDGTVTPKSYTRVWDGDVSAWRAWVPQNIWGISATEGVDVVAKKITLKDTTTGLVVDGASTLTGASTHGGVASFIAGTAAAPAITTTGDTNTGIAFTAADTVVVATGGNAAITVGPSQGVTMAANATVTGNLTVSGQMAANLNMGSNRITNLANPTAAQDAVTRSFLDTARIGQVVFVTFSTSGIPRTEQIGTSFSASPTVFTNPSSGIANIRCTAGQVYRGLFVSAGGSPQAIIVDQTGTAADATQGALQVPGNPFAFDLIRIT
jgi:hypothetical protein